VWVTIDKSWVRSGRELGEKQARTFTNFDRGTVDFKHMGVLVSRINTKVYAGNDSGGGGTTASIMRAHKTVQVKNGVLLFWREQKRTKNCWNIF
jgi:hypothetical protein